MINIDILLQNVRWVEISTIFFIVHTVVQFASSGTLKAWKTWTMYGRMDIIPPNWWITKQNITIANGLRVRFRVNSFSRSLKVGAGCVHSISSFWHLMQEFEFLL